MLEHHVYYCIGLGLCDLLQLKYQSVMEKSGNIYDIIHGITFGGINSYEATKFVYEDEAREALEEIKKTKIVLVVIERLYSMQLSTATI